MTIQDAIHLFVFFTASISKPLEEPGDEENSQRSCPAWAAHGISKGLVTCPEIFGPMLQNVPIKWKDIQKLSKWIQADSTEEVKSKFGSRLRITLVVFDEFCFASPLTSELLVLSWFQWKPKDYSVVRTLESIQHLWLDVWSLVALNPKKKIPAGSGMW